MEKYIYFNDIFQDYTKYSLKIPKNMYLKSGLYPIIDQGKEEIAGFSNQSTDIFNDVPIIIFGDHTRIFKYIDYPFFLGADGVKILKNISNLFLDKFLYYSIKNFKIPNTGYNRHFKWLKNFKIKYISLVEQKKIVNIIEKIEGFILQKKEQLNYLKKLNKSLFTTMFGDIKTNDKNWEIRKIEDCILNNIKNIDLKTNGEITYIDISSINNKENIISSYKKYDNIREAPSRAKKILNENDILISTVRPALKNIAIFNKKNSELTIGSTGFCVLRPKDTIDSKYIFEIIKSNNFTETLIKRQIGANYPAVSDRDIKSIKIPIPPIELQNKFAERVEKIEKLKFIISAIILNPYELLKNKGVEHV